MASCPFAPEGTTEKKERCFCLLQPQRPGVDLAVMDGGCERRGSPHAPTTRSCGIRSGGCSAGADVQGDGRAASLLGQRGKGGLPKPGTPALQPQPGPAKTHPHEHQLLAKSCPPMQVVPFPSPPPISFPIPLFSIHCSHFWGQAVSSSRMSPMCLPAPLSREQPRGSTSQGAQSHRRFSPGCQGGIALHLESSPLPRI